MEPTTPRRLHFSTTASVPSTPKTAEKLRSFVLDSDIPISARKAALQAIISTRRKQLENIHDGHEDVGKDDDAENVFWSNNVKVPSPIVGFKQQQHQENKSKDEAARSWEDEQAAYLEGDDIPPPPVLTNSHIFDDVQTKEETNVERFHNDNEIVSPVRKNDVIISVDDVQKPELVNLDSDDDIPEPELFNNLSKLTISDPVEVKKEQPLKKPISKFSKMLDEADKAALQASSLNSSPFEKKSPTYMAIKSVEGAFVTAYTPVRVRNASERNHLGCDKVITPVRRSLRIMSANEYDDKENSVKTPRGIKYVETVGDVMEKCGFAAYTPNKQLPK